MKYLLFIGSLLMLQVTILAQDSLSYVIIAHAFDNKEKAIAIAAEYAEKDIKCNVVEAGNSGIFRICLNQYPDYTSANISRRALIKSKTIPTDAWILTEKISKDLSAVKAMPSVKKYSTRISDKRYLIYNGEVYKVPVLKSPK